MKQENKNRNSWFGARANEQSMTVFGIRTSGGGTHQSKTMMLRELEALMASGLSEKNDIKTAILEENILGKSTQKTRAITLRHLGSLFGLIDQPPLAKALMKIWRFDKDGHSLQALLIALSRDPLLRETAHAVLDGAIGESRQKQLIEAALLAAFPGRFSEKMLQSLARNCASTWTQSGHLKGALKKVRQRVSPTPANVALAALIATAAGFGGPAILNSMWMQVLDLSPDQALDQLRRAEAIGLARVRSAGDVTEISIRQPMAATLGVRELEYV
jgi:hypothetical protein